MPVFLTREERALVSELRVDSRVRPFAEQASVDVGIVTGANKFFLAPDNSLTCLTAEMEGRHYGGGGGLELVPSEIERLLLPVVHASPAQLAAADERYRKAEGDLVFLRGQDAVVLTNVGVTKCDQEMLFKAWSRFRARRQRVPSAEETPEAE
jgi:hypothetical protein